MEALSSQDRRQENGSKKTVIRKGNEWVMIDEDDLYKPKNRSERPLGDLYGNIIF